MGASPKVYIRFGGFGTEGPRKGCSTLGLDTHGFQAIWTRPRLQRTPLQNLQCLHPATAVLCAGTRKLTNSNTTARPPKARNDEPPASPVPMYRFRRTAPAGGNALVCVETYSRSSSTKWKILGFRLPGLIKVQGRKLNQYWRQHDTAPAKHNLRQQSGVPDSGTPPRPWVAVPLQLT